MSSPEEILGKTISHYRILSPLGEGGMGIVYRAEDTRLGRTVAVKFVPHALARDRGALERFQREARAVSALNHPNICILYDIGEHESRPFLVMECLEGQTLADRIKAGPIALDELTDICVQIADALEMAHGKGIVHRDIKPANIFLTSRGQIKIMDFGLAKMSAPGGMSRNRGDSQMATAALADLVTSPGATVGTVAYMSPEQVSSEELDCRSDLFSFGIVIYEMATGVCPFHAQSTALTFVSIVDREPVQPTRLRPDLPAEMERIILKALEKNRDWRYQSAADIGADLRRLRFGSVSRRAYADQATLATTPASASAPAALSATKAGPSSNAPPAQPAPAPSTPPSSAPSAASSAEYIAQSIGRNRRAAIGIALVLTLAGATASYFVFREKPVDSLAVLPFANVNGDPNNEYLSDGIAESIINNLSQLPKLAVRSFSSTERYKGKNITPEEAGRELKVRAVLTGRLVRRGDGFVVSAELIDVNRNTQIWGSQYSLRPSDMLVTQEQISKQISQKLQMQLTGAEVQRIAHHTTEDSEAYQSYLQGRFHWNKRTLEGLQTSLDYFHEAIRKDPKYALAYAGEADAYASLAEFNVLPTREVMPKVRQAAEKAIELDDSLAEAHTSLAWARFQDWDWAAAEQEFKRAITLNPSYPTARLWYADFLSALGRFDEAQPELLRAAEISPLSPVTNLAFASRSYYAHQYTAAIEQCQKTLGIDLSFTPAHVVLGRAALAGGQTALGLAELQKALDLSEGDTTELAALAWGRALAGDAAAAKKTLAEIKQRSQETYVQPLAIARIYIALGQRDQAFDSLAKAFDDHSAGLVYLRVDPVFDPIRADARFTDLVRRVGLPASR